MTCAGTAGACASLVTCHEAAGYSGLPVVSCPTDDGYFRLRGCSRGPATSNTSVVYVVAPFQECDSSSTFLIRTLNGVTVQVCGAPFIPPRCRGWLVDGPVGWLVDCVVGWLPLGRPLASGSSLTLRG